MAHDISDLEAGARLATGRITTANGVWTNLLVSAMRDMCSDAATTGPYRMSKVAIRVETTAARISFYADGPAVATNAMYLTAGGTWEGFLPKSSDGVAISAYGDGGAGTVHITATLVSP